MIDKEKVLHNFLREFKKQDKPQVLANMKVETDVGTKIISL